MSECTRHRTADEWAFDYISCGDPTEKLNPPPIPHVFADFSLPVPQHPGRSSAFRISAHGRKSSGKTKLRSPEQRIVLIHTFLHHEIQAAELMAWAVLSFRDAPLPFRRGLCQIAQDEVRHARLYADYLDRQGVAYGDREVRDWFWERVPSVSSPAGFCAVMGMGFEAANLDHTQRFEARFRAADDDGAAELEAQVGRDEVSHVRFAAHWFQHFTKDEPGSLFERWARALPAPLSPWLMRGDPLATQARLVAGLDEAFQQALIAYSPCLSHSS